MAHLFTTWFTECFKLILQISLLVGGGEISFKILLILDSALGFSGALIKKFKEKDVAYILVNRASIYYYFLQSVGSNSCHNFQILFKIS